MINFFKNLIDLNQREVDRIQKQVDKINLLEDKYKTIKDTDFPRKTEEFKKRIKDGESLEDLLPDAYALVREASKRVLGMRPYDVQLTGGVVLFEGKIAEQKTGEGKTLTAVAPLYLRALQGNGAHLVTVNDYLAKIGAGWNAPLFEFLGLSVGVICGEQKSYIYDTEHEDSSHGDERLVHLKATDRKKAYEADITYGTNNEFGFDYLRDNMVPEIDRKVQRGHYFAIVDEVDQVLIDEARTPLIISAPDTEPTDKYFKFAKLVKNLKEEKHFEVDEKSRSATLTEAGVDAVEKELGVKNLYEEDFDAIHHIENALRAKTLFLKDKDYLVKDGEVTIVDEFTGRLMPGRRWSDGLHQAVEAKEGVQIKQESKTMATISFQNYFRLYDHLAGMTGTAATEADEFNKIYDLEVVVIPTNKPIARKDNSDYVYKTLNGKYTAIVEEIKKRHEVGQPVLVGTTSVEKNEILATQLKRKKVPHNILNAKNHEKEASTISDAGKPGAVTIATNMAGRGVDIVLGGAKPEQGNMTIEKYQKSAAYKAWQESHDKVIEAGGLMVIGTERHESRRIDNQLRGRSGRQGDPGESRFYLSLEDDLMRIFGGEQIKNVMERLKMPEDMPIENPIVSKAIEQSQVKVEGFHFDSRKRLVEYDDVANQQRSIIYKKRDKILTGEDLKDDILDVLDVQIDQIVNETWDAEKNEPDHGRLVMSFSEMIPFDEASRVKILENLEKVKTQEKLSEAMSKILDDTYSTREKQLGEQVMRRIERFAYLGAIDHLWVDHIDHIDGLREGVMLRGYAQKDPLVEFKQEAFTLFEKLLSRIDDELAKRIFRVQVATARPEIDLSAIQTNVDKSDKMGLRPSTDNSSQSTAASSKIGRNDPCPCGSGLKYKKCGLVNSPKHRG
jgi:preprotein translocase subunit SecA